MRTDIDRPAATHPADVLSAEHRVILSVLDALDFEAGRCIAGGKLRREFWREAAEFLERFADRCHHGKEEDLLFPALEAAGLPEGGPTDVMRSEHVEGRAFVMQMREAAARGDAQATAAATRGYVDLLRQHIGKEEDVLFEMARSLLGGDEAAALLHRFDDFDADDVGADELARLAGLARKLTAATD